jgi:YHS domain-containing protein
MTLKTLSVVVMTALWAACAQKPAAPGPGPAPPVEMRTIENTPIETVPVEAPPQITDQQAEPKLRDPHADEAAKQRAEEDLRKQVSLPFSPAIAMDPVDGAKVSIRSDTPVLEYQNKIYYFASAGNRAAFRANPQQYVKGGLAQY